MGSSSNDFCTSSSTKRDEMQLLSLSHDCHGTPPLKHPYPLAPNSGKHRKFRTACFRTAYTPRKAHCRKRLCLTENGEIQRGAQQGSHLFLPLWTSRRSPDFSPFKKLATFSQNLPVFIEKSPTFSQKCGRFSF